MNLLIVCTSPGLGGLELYSEREWQYLNHHIQGSVLFALSSNSRLEQRIFQENSDHLISARPRKFFPITEAYKLAKYIDTNHIDVIHMHWGNDLHYCVLAKLYSKRKPMLIYTRHMGITRPKKDLIHRFFYHQVDFLLAASKYVYDQAIQFLPLSAHQIKLFYLGVPEPSPQHVNCFTGLPNYKHGQTFNIGMFGRIEHGKGQHILVNGVIELAKKGMNVSAYIIGNVMDDAYHNELKKRISSAGAQDRIHFIDFVESPPRLMQCFDVIALLTYCETFGLILAEAMRSGICVIGTNSGGVPEIIDSGETGILIEPGNSNSFEKACWELYKKPGYRKQLALNGKVKADLHFNENTQFQTLIQDYLHS